MGAWSTGANDSSNRYETCLRHLVSEVTQDCLRQNEWLLQGVFETSCQTASRKCAAMLKNSLIVCTRWQDVGEWRSIELIQGSHRA